MTAVNPTAASGGARIKRSSARSSSVEAEAWFRQESRRFLLRSTIGPACGAGAMGDQGRADRTTDKTRRGGLPAATDYQRQPCLGSGRPCAGCNETMQPTDVMFTVTFFAIPDLSWQFHDVCFDAWSKFK
jgi:hypothetical protein